MWKKPFEPEAIESICSQISAVRAQAKAAGLIIPTVKLTPRDHKKHDAADLFARRFSVLRPALSFINQHEDVNFSTYEASIAEQVRALTAVKRFAERFLDRVVDGHNPAAGLLLVGTTGTGKTHLAMAALNALRSAGCPGFFLKASDLFDLFTPSFAGKLDMPIPRQRELLAGVSCLVIDDVGTGAWTDARRDCLQRIIDARVDNGLPTIITTNLTKKEFQEDGADRIISRLSEHFYPIVCTWEDYRKRKALKNMNFEEVF